MSSSVLRQISPPQREPPQPTPTLPIEPTDEICPLRSHHSTCTDYSCDSTTVLRLLRPSFYCCSVPSQPSNLVGTHMADDSWEEEKHEPHKKQRFDNDIDNQQEEEEQKWNLKLQVDDEFLDSVYDSENEDDAPYDEKKLSMGSPVYGPDDDYSSDSDGGMTPAEFRGYQKQVHDSQGFEVGYFSQNKTWCGLILPLPSFHKNPGVVDEVNRVSQLAIHKYNTDNNTKYEFVKVIKVNTRFVSGSVYYVTFEAKDSPAAADDGGQVETHIFQTRAYVPIKEEIEVDLCRLKPIS